jgi:hypothetical protein
VPGDCRCRQGGYRRREHRGAVAGDAGHRVGDGGQQGGADRRAYLAAGVDDTAREALVAIG